MPTGPLCSDCWEGLAPADQQLLAYAYNDLPDTYAHCLAVAVQRTGDRGSAAEKRRKAAAARSYARRTSPQIERAL